MFHVNLIFQKPRIFFKSFFEAEFKHCPLIRIFYSRSAKKKTNKLHGRPLRIVYVYCNFEEFWTKYGQSTIYHLNIQALKIEMFKIHHGFPQVSFLDLIYIIMKITFIAYDLNLNFKFQELRLLWNEHCLQDILDQ